MDGNRRWAQQRGLATFMGHSKGAETVKLIAQFCIQHTIPFLSLYAFSIENFNRSDIEKTFIFDLIADELEKNLPQFMQDGMRVRFIGDRSLFPSHLVPIIEEVESKTALCTKLSLNFLFCYGGRQEIAQATRSLARQVQAGIITPDEITPALFAQHAWTQDVPDPEIVIRPGAQTRLSNFLLFQSAYSELFFLDTLWPDITTKILEDVLQQFKQRRRNFGK